MAVLSDTVVEPQPDGVERLLSRYRPLAGIFDEMVDNKGQVRPHWRPFLTMLASLGADEINRRFAVADRYLHDSGVFYRVYEDPAGAERPWPLSHMPLIINPTEWATLKSGLVQRADLLELVLADAYGAARIVRDGLVPAVLIAGNPEFLHPLVGVAPPGGAHLRFYAVDVGRDAAPMAAGGSWATAPRRPRAPVSYSRAGSPCSAPCRKFIARSGSSGWHRFFRRFSPRSRGSIARTIRASACSRRGR